MSYRAIPCMLLIAVGCASNHGRPESAEYQTVGKDPRRDTEAARSDNLRALEALRKDDYTSAETALKGALAEDIMFGPAHNNLGKVYFHQNKLYLAAWEFEYAAKLMPHVIEPKNNIGLVFEAAGKWDEAVQQYTDALALEPGNQEVIANDARARIRRGDTNAELRQLLSKLVMIDTRPDWVEWARQKLVLLPLSGPTTQSVGEIQ